VYKQPIDDFESATTACFGRTVQSSALGFSSCLIMQAPPSTASEAIQLVNSRQWDAREGCYVIPTLHRQNLAPTLGNYTQPLYYTGTPGDGVYYGPDRATINTSPVTATFARCQNWTNFDQTGAIFSGLSLQSVLTINVRYYIEVFPSSNSPLQSLARPSPILDELALNIYSQIVDRAPIGVEVKFNGLGDWFIDGINAVKDMVLPVAGKMLSLSKHPVAQAASMAIKGFSGKKGKAKKAGKEQTPSEPKGKKKKKKAAFIGPRLPPRGYYPQLPAAE